MKKLFERLLWKQDPAVYQQKDAKLTPSLRTIDLIGLGTGMVVGTAIFTLPGIVAAEHTGPAVPLAFIVAAIGAGLSALAYAEMSSVLPFAGSAFSWINVLFGEFFGWIAGWALLAEYFISVAFVASGWSAYMQGFLASLGIKLPVALTGGFNPRQGSYVDILAAVAILAVGILISRGVHQVSRIENIIVAIKLLVIIMFIVVGATAIQAHNYVPFIPAHRPGTSFGGWQGIIAGTAQIFIAYVGFDAIAANTAETKNPQKTMPRGLIGTLVLGTGFFIAVSLVLVGMFKYSRYANNAEPAAWALRQSGHYLTANLLSVVAIIGIFSALIAILLASSRLIYAFGRDGLLPSRLGIVNGRHVPRLPLCLLTVLPMVLCAVFPFTSSVPLLSAGTLVAFIFVSLGIYALRPREGKNLPDAQFKMPWYPVLPTVSALFSAVIFWGLNKDAKILMVGWFVIGLLIYFVYGIRHSIINQEHGK